MVSTRNKSTANSLNKDANLSEKMQTSMKSKMQESTANDPAWDVLTNKPGLNVWRIHDFKAEAVDAKDHGTFFDGDSYVVLHTYLSKSNCINYDVFIWIGKNSTADEYGTAAYKMAELDVVVLNDMAIQHREVQSNESDKFTSLFPTMGVMKGGYETGFNIIKKTVPEPRLLHISGIKKNVKIEEVSYRRDNLSEDDVFIVDLGDNVYQVNGAKCSKDEKFKGASVINDMKSQRPKSKYEVIDDFTTSTKHPVIEAMPLKNKSTVKKQTAAKREKSLWRLSDESGKIEMTKVATGSLKKSMLDTKDVFIVDSDIKIFIWVGKATSKNEKMLAMSYGQKYADSISLPKIPLVKVTEGMETEEMLSAFN